ncbi:hypothetical protein [Parasitella parasitica]|uniref:Ndc10 domain-containing protein n=1 Tax=Parasitella parasitica TaxID=35722 RepID=A0A0B7MQI3_9FUNG|nr:hypothetical protein [Parasitella parasitica]
MDTLARKESKKKRDEYYDRAALTIGDGYTTVEELTALVAHYIKQNSEEGLRNALICLLSHYMYLRGASARQAELADLQSLHFTAEGPTPCPALLFLMTESKSNKHGPRRGFSGHDDLKGLVRN